MIALSFPRSVRHGVLFSMFSVVLATGCVELPGLGGGGGQSDGEAEEEVVAPLEFEAEEGSCNAWKISYCDAIEACSAFASADECQVDVGFVRCLPDAPFGECQARIDAAVEADRCEDLPSECTPQVIADRTIPIQQCMAIYESMCEFNFYCGLENSIESCVAAMNTSNPCTDFTAAWPGAEVCPDLIDSMSCGDAVPPECIGVLRE